MWSASGEGGSGSGSDDDSFDSGAYLDAADRLERAMDTQIQIIEGIDTKAEHVTRLIALLLGILFSVISFVTQLRQTPFVPPPSMVLATFGIGVGSLLVSMIAAVVTYLSSQYKIGLRGDIGEFLSDPSVSTNLPEHVRNVLGIYAFVIGQNRQVIETNVFWFRLTLLFLLYGISFVSLSDSSTSGTSENRLLGTGYSWLPLSRSGSDTTPSRVFFLPLQDENEANG